MNGLSYSFTPRRGVLVATVLFLIGLGITYFFLYIPRQQADLDEQQFRCLQNIEKNVNEKINNSLSLLEILIDNYKNPKYEWNKKSIVHYIRGYPKTNFSISINTKVSKKTKDSNLIGIDKQVIPKNTKLPSTVLYVGNINQIKNPPLLKNDTCFVLNNKGLLVRRKINTIVLDINYTLEQFFNSLLRKDLFNDYIVLNESQVLYQTFPTGVAKLVTDSIKNEKGLFTFDPIKNITLSGTTYKLFIQQIRLDHQTVITIAGLLKKETYDQNCKRLPNLVIISLLVLAMLGVLALPWIKIYQIGANDRLTSMDGLLCIGTALLLASVIIYSFMEFSRLFRNGSDQFDKSSQCLYSSIEKSFRKEIAERYNSLKIADKFILKGPKTKTIAFSKTIKISLNNLYSKSGVQELFCLDSDGKEKHNWYIGNKGSPPPGDYSNRDYFKQLKFGRPYQLPGSQKENFSLEPVISRTTGKFTTIMALKSAAPDLYCSAISFSMVCLSNPILPSGFTVAVIDSSGRVIYHTDSVKQLNENLYQEFSEGKKLSGAVHSGSDRTFSTKYANNQYEVRVGPLQILNYSLVVMESSNFKNYRNNGEFMFSFIMIGIYFTILGLEGLLLFFITIKPIYYKKHYFDISWLGPDRRFSKEYKYSFWSNLILVCLLLITILFQPNFFSFLLILLIANCFSHLFQYSLYSIQYKGIDNPRFKLKITGFHIVLGLLLFYNFLADFCATILVFEIIAGLVLALFFFIISNLNKTPIDYEKHYFQNYIMMTFSRILMVSILPVSFFFISIYNYQVLLEARFHQVGILKALSDFNEKNPRNKIAKPYYLDHVWVDSIEERKVQPNYKVATNEELNIKKIFKYLTPGNEQDLPGIKALDNKPIDGHWIFSKLIEDSITSTDYMKTTQNLIHSSSSNEIHYTFPSPFKKEKWKWAIGFWALMFVTFICFWRIFQDVLQRLFTLNLANDSGWTTIDTILLENNKLNNLLFLIGSPGAEKREYITNLIKKEKLKDLKEEFILEKKKKKNFSGFFIANMILIPNNPSTEPNFVDNEWEEMKKWAFDPSTQLVIVDQFEYDIKNASSNRIKLSFLEELLQKGTAKVIIISTVHPVNFLDSLNQDKDIDNKLPNNNPEHELERWHVLLGHFKIIIKQLANTLPSGIYEMNWNEVLKYETRSGRFLNGMNKPILNNKNKLISEGMTTTGLILKLSSTAHYYYMYNWQSLTKEEKFILFDLAEDGLVNSYDDYNLLMLIAKGLIVNENGVLKLFNEGFREFILTAIGPTEFLQIQQQIRDNGNWGKLRPILILLIIAVLVFLFTSQQESYTDFLKFAAIITGGVPLVTQVFSMINGVSVK